jgi:hypothetical protein
MENKMLKNYVALAAIAIVSAIISIGFILDM